MLRQLIHGFNKNPHRWKQNYLVSLTKNLHQIHIDTHTHPMPNNGCRWICVEWRRARIRRNRNTSKWILCETTVNESGLVLHARRRRQTANPLFLSLPCINIQAPAAIPKTLSWSGGQRSWNITLWPIKLHQTPSWCHFWQCSLSNSTTTMLLFRRPCTSILSIHPDSLSHLIQLPGGCRHDTLANSPLLSTLQIALQIVRKRW